MRRARPVDGDPIHTTQTAAVRLRCSPENIRRLENLGHLKALRTASGQRLFRESDLDEYARLRAAAGGEQR